MTTTPQAPPPYVPPAPRPPGVPARAWGPPPAPRPTATRGRRPFPLARLRAFGRPPRLLGLDVARAVAVIGMVGAHVGAVREPFAWGEPAT